MKGGKMRKQAVISIKSEEPKHFGQGWISGVLAVVLGVIGLGTVICFRFPTLLTVPEARLFYLSSMPVIRITLQLVLIGAFVSGVISALLRQNKLLGLTGSILVLITLLLGGADVPVGKPLPPGPYLGLDWFILNLILFSAIFIPLERMFARIDQPIFREDWQTDSTYFFISTLSIEILTYTTFQPARSLFHWALNRHLQEWVTAQPGILQFIEILFCADIMQYWVHRMFHQIPALWKIHSVHHSTEKMDWLAGSRTHFIDVIATRASVFIPIYILGFKGTPLICYVVFIALQAVFVHANVRFAFGPVRWILTTPRFHHWHHGAEKEAIDKNFAVHLPLLDMLFGTFYLPEDKWPENYGIENNPVPKGWLRQFIYPFLKKDEG